MDIVDQLDIKSICSSSNRKNTIFKRINNTVRIGGIFIDFIFSVWFKHLIIQNIIYWVIWLKYVWYELYEVWTSLCILLSVADSFKLVVASSSGGKHIRASVCDYGDAGSLEVSPFLKNSWAKLFFWK